MPRVNMRMTDRSTGAGRFVRQPAGCAAFEPAPLPPGPPLGCTGTPHDLALFAEPPPAGRREVGAIEPGKQPAR